jgi:hypothetical protein
MSLGLAIKGSMGGFGNSASRSARQRMADRAAKRTASIFGGGYDFVTNAVDAMGPKQLSCAGN